MPRRAAWLQFQCPSESASWSPDGKWIVVTQLDIGQPRTSGFMPASGGSQTLHADTRDSSGPISPSEVVAYASDEQDASRRCAALSRGHASGLAAGRHRCVWTRDDRQLVLASADLRLWQWMSRPAGTFSKSPRLIAAFRPASCGWTRCRSGGSSRRAGTHGHRAVTVVQGGNQHRAGSLSGGGNVGCAAAASPRLPRQ
jgi:hypothetical protein